MVDPTDHALPTLNELSLNEAQSDHRYISVIATPDGLELWGGGPGGYERVARINQSSITNVTASTVQLRYRTGAGIRMTITHGSQSGQVALCVTGGGLLGIFPMKEEKIQRILDPWIGGRPTSTNHEQN